MRRRRTITVLSEHSLCRQSTADVLRREGCRVVEYATHVQLLAAPPAYDAIVVDLDHASYDTFALIERLRELDKPLVLLGTSARLAAVARDDSAIETPEVDVGALARAACGRART